VTVRVYVEGGGDNKALQTECRRGFSEFVKNTGLDNRMPKVIACGGRQQAFKDFRTAHTNAEQESFPILLVDSEAAVTGTDPWQHVKSRPGDGWGRPKGASSDQFHFMVQTMEAWLYADKKTLGKFYGNAFRANALSARLDIDNIPKTDLFDGLERATRDCQKGEYSKGDNSFRRRRSMLRQKPLFPRFAPACSSVFVVSPCAPKCHR
jgi:hypothetical protein